MPLGLVHDTLGPDDIILTADGPRLTALGVSGAGRRVPADDIPALGAVVIFAATGREPAAGDTPGAGVLPPSLREVIGGCLYEDPSTRPTAAPSSSTT